jgi:aminopeptidase N
MEQASGFDLSQFRRWYSTAGTPIYQVRGEHDAIRREYRLTIELKGTTAPGETEIEPFHFPMKIGLIAPDGTPLPLECRQNPHENGAPFSEHKDDIVVSIRARVETLVFRNIDTPPVPSLLRDFSAPVLLSGTDSDDVLSVRFRHDRNLFNRYDAGQRLYLLEIERVLETGAVTVRESLVAGFRATLVDDVDPNFVAMALTLPSLTAILEPREIYDVAAAFSARRKLSGTLACATVDLLLATYEKCKTGTYSNSAHDVGRRKLKNRCLSLLLDADEATCASIAMRQFESADNMTDQIAALGVLCDSDSPLKQDALEHFRKRWSGDHLTMNKWFAVQSGSRSPDTIETVMALSRHHAFDPRNPNRLRALYGSFAANLPQFHHESGRGYRLIADSILEIDTFNPTLAARLAKAFGKTAKLPDAFKKLANHEIERMLAMPDLSAATYEILSNTTSEASSEKRIEP